MDRTASEGKSWKNWLRKRSVLIGLVVLVLGTAGLAYELLRPSEEEIFEDLIVAYDDEVGFAPFFAAEEAAPSTTASGPQATVDPQDPPATPEATPDPNTAQATMGLVPDYLEIPSIRLEAPIVPIDHVQAELEGVTFRLWLAPWGYNVGWHSSSSLIGLGGNTVLNGHHNAYMKVFENLIDVEEGDLVIVSSGEHQFQYIVTIKVIFPERFETFETRMVNTVWIEPTVDERITLVTCWPATTNTHRLIIVAEPYSEATDPLDSLLE